MNTKEIVSLQFGHYPNFVGAHWWNIQEAGFEYFGNTPSEVNHDVLYREGLTSKGEVTFTPRLLLADLKGSLKTLPECGQLYEPTFEPSVSSVEWPNEAVEVSMKEKFTKNEFHEALFNEKVPNLDDISTSILKDKIEVWSDYLYAQFHPRTVNIIKEFEHNNSNKQFDIFPLGTSLWQNSDFSEDFTDKIRNYIEECDNLQGFHLILEATNAFGGLSASCIDYIKDEYDKKSILAFASIPSYYLDYKFANSDEREQSTLKDSMRLVNLTLCLDAVSENSSLTIPICTGDKGWRQPGNKRTFNHVQYDSEAYYHSSAILATALDTLTMPYRTKSSAGFTLADFCADLNGNGRKIAGASVSLPFSINRGQDFIDCLDNWDGPLWKSITPNCTISEDKTMQLITLRGVSESRLKQPPQLAERQRKMAAYQCDSVKDMLSFYLSCNSYATISHVTVLNHAMPVKTPYPDIFDKYVDVDGNITSKPRTMDENVKSIPVIAGCHTGSGLGNMLEILHKDASRIKMPRLHQFTSAGLEADDYKECLNRLLDLRECYEQSYE